MGTATQFILAWRSGWGPGSHVAYLPGLRREARRYGHYQGRRKAWVMMIDSGFDGQTAQDDDLIPPIRRGGNLLNPERKARADPVSQARLDGLFGQQRKPPLPGSSHYRLAHAGDCSTPAPVRAKTPAS